MNQKVHHLLIVILFASMPLSLFSQTADLSSQNLQQQLNRLKEKIQEAKNFSRLISNPKINEVINRAEEQYRLAVNAQRERKYKVALSHTKMAYAILTKLFQEIRNIPNFSRRFKNRLDQKIQEAEQITRASNNPEAKRALNRAKYFRQRAIRLANSGKVEPALKNYSMAIFFAENSIRTSEGTDGGVIRNMQRYMEDSKNLLLQAREMATTSQNSTIRNILKKAENEFREAKVLYDSNQLKEAYQKLQIVNRLLYRMLDLLEDTPDASSDRIMTDLQILEENLVEFKDKLAGQESPELKRIYDRLVFLTSSIRQNFDRQQIAKARQQLSIANRLLLQLNRRLNASANLPANQIANQIETAEIMYTSLEQHSRENTYYQPLMSLLNQNLTNAKNAYRSGDEDQAILFLKHFNNLALKLDQMRTLTTLRSGREERVQENFQRLEELLNQQPALADMDPLLKIKYQNARKLYEIAKDACQEDTLELCWQITRMALNILTQ